MFSGWRGEKQERKKVPVNVISEEKEIKNKTRRKKKSVRVHNTKAQEI